MTGTFGTAASNVGQSKLKRLFEGRGITFAFGPAFQWNILNYGQITNQVRIRDAALQGLLVDYQNTVLKAQQEAQGVSIRAKSPSILEFVTLDSPDGSRDALFMWNYATINLVNELSRLPGVGNVTVRGRAPIRCGSGWTRKNSTRSTWYRRM